MVTPTRSQAAVKNLREGIKKMDKVMTPAALVRREFRLGRPPKAPAEGEIPQPLHPAVAWQRAKDALAAFRERMANAGLNPKDAEAAIIYIQQANPDQPHFLMLEAEGKSEEEMRAVAYALLARADVIALGMMFNQFDEHLKKRTIFPHLFFGLNQRGNEVIKKAAKLQEEAAEILKNQH